MKKRYLIGLVVIALAGIALVYAFKIGRAPINDRPQPEGQAQSASGHQGHDALMPQEEAAQETAPEGSQEEAPTIEIPLDRQQIIGVRTVEVAVRQLQKVIRTVGRVEYDERRIATVNSKFEGWIEKLHIDYTGRYVKKGEPLAGIYSPELVATQQEFINALKWARRNGEAGSNEIKAMLSRDAYSLVEAARQRLKFWDISDEQIKRIEESGKPVRVLTLYSPVSGYVVQKMAFQGMRAMPGEKLFDIADLSSVWVLSDIYEYDLPVIRAGQTAKISLSYLPGREFTSTIEYVYPALSGEARTAKVRFTIANPGGQLKPQMFSNVEVKIPMGRRLAVPDVVVLDTGRRQIVYVDKGDGYFEPREVKIGVKADGFQEILAGLSVGEKVASSANFLIDSEAQLKGVTPLAGGHKH
jgi:Cu(I)/Ag(I) efflux system membrane fusion protein